MITKIDRYNRTIKSYGIRKFTPRECFRLMGVRDESIDRMQVTYAKAKESNLPLQLKGQDDNMVVSVSQQYKQAGNSIVVDVLAAIYEQIWFPRIKEAGQQTSLFDLLDAMEQRPTDSNTKIFITTFSGYDSQLLAAELLSQRHPDFHYTCAGWSEIDKYACQMHDLIFPQYANKALGDITKIDWHQVKDSLNGQEVDMLTYSSPCTDVSQAGKQMGLKEGSGTRSALLWNVSDAIEILKPKYLLQENVAALVSQKFMPDFQKWLDRLNSIGYVSYWTTLNAKDYGVPQNRDRVFCLSIRRDLCHTFSFPEPQELTTKLEDMLETEVEQRYFLNDQAVGKYLTANDNSSDIFYFQFDIEQGHENAMFLKTWLQTIALSNGQIWTATPELFYKIIDMQKGTFYELFNEWKANGKFPSIIFEKEYLRNLNRNDNADSVREA